MKVKTIHIHNYRSIVDSTEVDIEETVTVLIGKNEQGKTNFLRGIQSFNVDKQYSPSDLPNHKRAGLEESPPSEVPIVSIRFTIDKDDRTKLKAIDGIEATVELKGTKYYDNHYSFWLITEDGAELDLKFVQPDLTKPTASIKGAARNLLDKLKTHGQRVPDFATNIEKAEQFTNALLSANFRDTQSTDDITKTYLASIRTLSPQDEPILADVTSAAGIFEKEKDVIRQELLRDQSTGLKDSFPNFIVHSTNADRIPNEVIIANFTKDPDGTSKGMANLCRAAGLSVQKVFELAETTDTPQREVFEDHYKGTISGGLNAFWTQKEYTVHFRIDKERLSVSISDGAYMQRVPPSDRSDGFQWYLSFYATLINDMSSVKKSVILLDNPGLELHLDGQRDIKRFLEEKVALESQVVYVTHSPAMIDPFNLVQVRSVELADNNAGTKVKKIVLTGGMTSDLLEPVRSAVGMSLVSSLVLNEWNILVEGAADKPIVEGVFVEHYQEYKNKFMVNGSLSESKGGFLANFYQRAGLPFVVLLDADSGGRDLYNELIASGIPKERIVQLDKVFPKLNKDFAMEDIVSNALYLDAVKLAYPEANSIASPPDDTGKKRCNAYESLFKQNFGIGFSKRRVAEKVKRLLHEKKEDEETHKNLGELSTAIVEILKKQTPALEKK